MENFLKWFNESPIASFLRSFFAIVLAQAVSDFAKLGKFDFSNLEDWLIAGLVAMLPVALRLLNPKDKLTL